MAAQPKKAKHKATATVPPIQISFNPTSGYGFIPTNTVLPGFGPVQFIASQACWVWTFVNNALANVFTAEQSDHVQCAVGPANSFTVMTQYANATITIVGTALNAAPPQSPSRITDTLKGTIKVGS
jgi:hypothetical protein